LRTESTTQDGPVSCPLIAISVATQIRDDGWAGQATDTTADFGQPAHCLLAIEPDGVHARHYTAIGREVWTAVASGTASRPAPRVIIE